jgi:hypothetical protein
MPMPTCRFPLSLAKPIRLVLPLLVAITGAVSVTAGLAGCQGGGFGAFDPKAAAMAALSESVKSSVRSYLAGMQGVITELAEVRDLTSAMQSIEKLKPYAQDIDRVMPELRKLTPQDLDHVRVAFGPELESLAADFDAQAERLAGSGSIGTILRSALERIQPFTAS